MCSINKSRTLALRWTSRGEDVIGPHGRNLERARGLQQGHIIYFPGP